MLADTVMDVVEGLASVLTSPWSNATSTESALSD